LQSAFYDDDAGSSLPTGSGSEIPSRTINLKEGLTRIERVATQSQRLQGRQPKNRRDLFCSVLANRVGAKRSWVSKWESSVSSVEGDVECVSENNEYTFPNRSRQEKSEVYSILARSGSDGTYCDISTRACARAVLFSSCDVGCWSNCKSPNDSNAMNRDKVLCILGLTFEKVSMLLSF